MNRLMNPRVLVASAVAALVIGGLYLHERASILNESVINKASASIAANPTLPFNYPFSVAGTLEETGEIDSSSSPYWWLNSGGIMQLVNGVGQTVQGNLPIGAKWQKIYALSNPVDTDAGLHPQNIFRLILRSNWQDISQSLYFKINKLDLSASPNRNMSNGILLMSRYLDQNDLYYTGLRVDGTAIIKKKYQGRYYTMAQNQVLPGKAYDALTNPNLLPLGTKIGLKAIVKNLSGGRVSISLYTDIGRTNTWTLAAQAIDDASSFGGPAITAAGHTGVRTDFMDVEFDDYSLVKAP